MSRENRVNPEFSDNANAADVFRLTAGASASGTISKIHHQPVSPAGMAMVGETVRKERSSARANRAALIAAAGVFTALLILILITMLR